MRELHAKNELSAVELTLDGILSQSPKETSLEKRRRSYESSFHR
jgi:hypothetical protein